MAGHRRIVEQFYDHFGEGDLDAALAMFSAGIRITDPGLGTVEGLEAVLPFADFARIRDDLIVEYRTNYDQVSLLAQLGQTE
jgi:ketosteroid isomerase-like protein